MQQQLHQYLRNMQPFFYVLGNDLLASPHQAKRNLSSHHPSFWMWSKYANVGTPWTPSGPEPSRVAIRHNNILFSHDSVMTSFSVIDQDGCVSRFQRYHSTLSSHCVKKNADWCTNAPVGSGGHDTRLSYFCFRHSLCLKDWNVKVTFFSNECLIQRTFTYQYGPSLHALSALYTPGPATPPHSTPPHPWPVELATNRGGGCFLPIYSLTIHQSVFSARANPENEEASYDRIPELIWFEPHKSFKGLLWYNESGCFFS